MPKRILWSLVTQGQATHPAGGTVDWVGWQWIDFVFIKSFLCPDYCFFTNGFKVSWLYGVLLPRSGYSPHIWPWFLFLLCQFLLPFSLAALCGSIRAEGWGLITIPSSETYEVFSTSLCPTVAEPTWRRPVLLWEQRSFSLELLTVGCASLPL